MINCKLKMIEQMSEGNGLEAVYEDITVQGVSIDSRTVKTGNLFIPIQRQLNGHDYVEAAYSQGAAASFWQKDHPNPPQHIPLIYVDDCLEALQALAAHYRKELSVKVIGVTGSNGKTTTKDMINSVLGTTFRVHKTTGNLNSQIGLPLTILEMEKNAEIAVLEMGMSERGQIERLSEIAKPDLAVITMIGVSHLSTLGSREEIAAAKLEIVNGLPDNGVLIYNGDEPLLSDRLKEITSKQALSTITFGEGEANGIHVTSSVTNPEGSFFTVEDHPFFIPLLGAHNISNALAAIAIASKLGLSPTEIDSGFRALQVTGMRMEKIVSSSGIAIINDAWNASPVSMSAAIKTFEELTGYARKFLVLGDMLELGDQEQEFHREIGRIVDSGKIDFVYTFGNLARHIAEEAQARFPEGHVQSFLDKEKLTQVLKKRVKPNDAVLLKGSRGMQLEFVIPELLC
ncbi:UDP-N-acetylmuramoyl-tripeptide--D-alanyl-D-alanine ligase [Paenibacillus konkukensis]|uniref:UDP-N-acetylmuramoyl-tripeptide--D-alanyl-D-alanine ligase n=1 Tax=Paenibacillus konkukensis TaxID=2020716 RepID=A0ABY4RHP2_9BACL|nr:UDP-N-acetylmuramoyl-tripeptide--D-alanyl-D-alanine ligase [Paenibacillus konkukensis]UQZ81043.1 UDP-N-acetylmuramoyl-tripeptide--D-alanyl-D-alanine ligase [Paenibacillus konkukensis]